jgi:FtsP/CotA-like multicopper oxidase with cupredoxin domain
MIFGVVAMSLAILVMNQAAAGSIGSYSSSSIGSSSSSSSKINSNLSAEEYDKLKNCTTDTDKRPNSLEYLTHFNCGRVSQTITADGGKTTLREFTLIVRENQPIPISDQGHVMDAWTFNGTVPGPTIRMTEGDLVRITVINDKENKHSHTMHMHSIHKSEMDGVQSNAIMPGDSFVYEFIAQPFGVYPYHCHIDPIADHINRGLYGAFIIDPKTPRPQMPEMVMMLNGYDLDYDQEGMTTIRPPENGTSNTTTTTAAATTTTTAAAVVPISSSSDDDDDDDDDDSRSDDDDDSSSSRSDDDDDDDSSSSRSDDDDDSSSSRSDDDDDDDDDDSRSDDDDDSSSSRSDDDDDDDSSSSRSDDDDDSSSSRSDDDDDDDDDSSSSSSDDNDDAAAPSLEEKEGEVEEEERDNEIYTANGKAFDYMNHPIALKAGQEYRIYVVNMLEFDLVNSFHVHGAMFDYYPAGTSMTPQEDSSLHDVLVLGQGDRGIMEIEYKYPGKYMFHAHVTEFTDLGWMGFFNVAAKGGNSTINSSNNETTAMTGHQMR